MVLLYNKLVSTSCQVLFKKISDFLAKKADQELPLLIGILLETLVSMKYYSTIFANSTMIGIAIKVRSIKIKNSFQRFSGISLLIMIAPTSVK